MNFKHQLFWGFIFVLSVSLSLFSIACKRISEKIPPSGRKIQIVTTTGMIADIAKNVGGVRVSVQALMGPGVDPHLYRASEGDVQKLSQADIIFYNGLHLEAKMGEIFQQMVEPRHLTVAVTKTIDPTLLRSPKEFQGFHDPHVWFDVSMWMKAVEVIRDTLIKLDAEHKEIYQKNADTYLANLQIFHREVKEKAYSIPENRRILVTAHDAFGYFGHAYGFKVIGLQGISTESEAGTRDVQRLVDFIVKQKIRAIFVESSIPRRNVEAVQAAAKARGWTVQIGGQLYSDAMGAENTPEGTYMGMVRHNIDTLVKALK